MPVVNPILALVEMAGVNANPARCGVDRLDAQVEQKQEALEFKHEMLLEANTR